jgi:hypothetical protein
MYFEVHVVATDLGAKYYRAEYHTSQVFFLDCRAHKR